MAVFLQVPHAAQKWLAVPIAPFKARAASSSHAIYTRRIHLQTPSQISNLFLPFHLPFRQAWWHFHFSPACVDEPSPWAQPAGIHVSLGKLQLGPCPQRAPWRIPSPSGPPKASSLLPLGLGASWTPFLCRGLISRMPADNDNFRSRPSRVALQPPRCPFGEEISFSPHFWELK